MKQSRSTSLIKSIVSTAVGFGVAFLANMIILPWFGLDISHGANFILTCIYTVISIARGYALERVYEAMGWRTRMSAFALAVLAERQRQIHGEGYSTHDDDNLERGDLAKAGGCYAMYAGEPAHMLSRLDWPWDDEWYKPTGFRRDLVKGAALILAEGERFDRNRKRKPDLAGGDVNKGGHNDWPSQVAQRPAPPPASNKAEVIPQNGQQPQLSPESKSAA